MPFTTEYQGVYFVEGYVECAKIICELNIDLTRGLGAHLKNLQDVKNAFVKEAKANGANAVINFTYGQKRRWFSADGVGFWGKGQLAIVDPSTLKINF